MTTVDRRRRSTISGSPHWPLNSARAASTACVNGLSVAQGLQPVRRERHRQQDPRQQEQRHRDDLDDRRERVLALEDRARPRTRAGATARPIRHEQGQHDDEAEAGRPSSPNGIAKTMSMIAPGTSGCTTSRSDRPRSIAPRLIGVTRIRSMTPVAQLGDEPEADERRPEDRDLDEQAGHEPVERVGACGRPGCAPSSSGPNRNEVEQGQHHPEDHPDGLPDGQPRASGGRSARCHERVCIDGVPLWWGGGRDGDDGGGHAAGSSRSERPVWRRKTSSRLGRASVIVRAVRPCAVEDPQELRDGDSRRWST